MGLTWTDVKKYYAGTANKTGTGTWIESQSNKTENSPELDPSKYKNLVYNKKYFLKWGNYQLFNKWC